MKLKLNSSFIFSFVLLFVFSLLIISCPNNLLLDDYLNSNKINTGSIPPGKGAFYLSLDNNEGMRTILPDNIAWHSFSGTYSIVFFNEGTLNIAADGTRNNNTLSAPFFLAAGRYDILITAFLDGDPGKPVAQGQRDSVQITAGLNGTHVIRLKPIDEDDNTTQRYGEFIWNIVLPAGLSFNKAEMVITPHSTGTTFSGTPIISNLVSSGGTGSLDMRVGMYRVEVTLEAAAMENIFFVEALYVFQNMKSVFNFNFESKYFSNSPVVVKSGGVSTGHPTLTAALGTVAAGEYEITVHKDQTIAPYTLPNGARITLLGGEEESKISLSANGAMFTLADDSRELTLGNNITLVGRGSASTGPNNMALIYMNRGTLAMENGSKITGNENLSADSAGIFINAGIFTMNGGTISGNIAYKGAGVFMLGGTFTMNDGLITGNKTTSADGAVGGGVVVAGGATFNMTGGVITDNEAISGSAGGGIHISGGTLNISNNALITGNTASGSGGGINITGGNVNITGGAITKNKASNGGGIFITHGIDVDSTLTMTGGRIGGDSQDGNIAPTGGGVAFYFSPDAATGTFIVGGNAVIKNNRDRESLTGAIASNVFLQDTRYITLGSPATGMDIGVTKTANDGVFVNTGATATHVPYFSADGDKKKVIFDASDRLRIVDTASVTVSFNGGAASDHDSLEDAFDYIEALGSGTYVVTLNENQTLATTILDIRNTNIILLSGGGERIITFDDSQFSSMFMLSYADISLTLSNNITLKGKEGSGNALIHYGTLIMEEGSKITGHYIGVSAQNFTMNGGEISGNSIGVDVNGTTNSFNMKGGKVVNNTRDVSVAQLGQFTLSENAVVGHVRLSATSSNNSFSRVTVASNWVGSVTSLSLGRMIGFNDLLDLMIAWNNKQIIVGEGFSITAAEVAKFPLGDFIPVTGGNEPISQRFFVSDSGILTLKPEAAKVRVMQDSSIETNFLDLTSAFASFDTSQAGTFDVTLFENQNLAHRPVGSNQIINIVGHGGMRTITHTGAANFNMFIIENPNASLTLENNITLQGKSENTVPLVTITNGNFTVGGNVKILGNNTNISLAADRYITLNNPAAGMDIGVTKTANNGIFTTGANVTADHMQYFRSDNTARTVTYNGSQLQLVDTAYLDGFTFNFTPTNPVQVPTGNLIIYRPPNDSNRPAWVDVEVINPDDYHTIQWYFGLTLLNDTATPDFQPIVKLIYSNPHYGNRIGENHTLTVEVHKISDNQWYTVHIPFRVRQ